MYYVLTYNNKLVGVTPFEVVPLEGVSIQQYDGDVPDLNKMLWDEESQQLTHKITPISRLEFMSRFTMTERINIQSSTDPIVKDAMTLLQMVDVIDVTDQRTMMTVGYLAMQGLIDNSRVQEILT